jgi:hypothetical protein
VRASANIHPPVELLQVIPQANVLPLVVIVLPVEVDVNVIVPVDDHVVFATIVKLPAQLSEGEVPVAKVNALDPVQSSDKQFNAPVIVTVPVPDPALKNTLSVAAGLEAPIVPAVIV